MTGTQTERFDAAFHGVTVAVKDGYLVTDGVDVEAERALTSLAGGTSLLLNLLQSLEVAVPEVGIVDSPDLLPAMRASAELLDRVPHRLPDGVEPLTLWMLCTTRTEPEVALLVASHPDTPGPGLARMLRFWSASTGSTTGLSERMVNGTRVIEAIARNEATPPNILAGLASNNANHIQLAVASNPSTPLKDLRRMQLGVNPRLRQVAGGTIDLLAARHQHTSADSHH